MRTSECKGCGAKIVWALTARGKRMALDAEPAASGTFFITGTTTVTGEDTNIPLTFKIPEPKPEGPRFTPFPGPRYVPHWVTCPNRDDFRKPRKEKP